MNTTVERVGQWLVRQDNPDGAALLWALRTVVEADEEPEELWERAAEAGFTSAEFDYYAAVAAR